MIPTDRWVRTHMKYTTPGGSACQYGPGRNERRGYGPSRNSTLDREVTWLRALISRLVLYVADQVIPKSSRSEVIMHPREMMVTDKVQ